MIQHNDELLDHITGESRDPAMARMLAQLDRAYAATVPPHLDVSMDQAMHAHLAARRQPTPASTPVAPHSNVLGIRQRLLPARMRLLYLAAAVLVVVGIAGSLALGSQPASAQAILSQAAAFHLGADQAAHLTYEVTLAGGQKDGMTGTADVWLQANASGVPVLSAQTLVAGPSAKGPRPVGMVSRFIQDGQQVYAYDAGHNAILLGATARDDASWIVPPEIFSGVSVAEDLRAIAALSPQRVQALPPQTIAGHEDDVIEVTGWINRPAQQTFFYFDSQDFILRGFRIASTDPAAQGSAWQAWLTSDNTLAASAVPAHTFTLNAPVGARAEFHDAPLAAFATACHATTMTRGLLASGHQTPLAVCQATAPDVTASSLIASLVAPAQAQLDAALAAGQISSAQESASLASLRTQLAAWIATPGVPGR